MVFLKRAANATPETSFFNIHSLYANHLSQEIAKSSFYTPLFPLTFSPHSPSSPSLSPSLSPSPSLPFFLPPSFPLSLSLPISAPRRPLSLSLPPAAFSPSLFLSSSLSPLLSHPLSLRQYCRTVRWWVSV